VSRIEGEGKWLRWFWLRSLWVRLSEEDEIIRNRFEAAGFEGVISKEKGLWPAEFWLE
jgi:hypothetical protein